MRPKSARVQAALDFYNGDQWPANILAARKAAGRPCLVFNRIPEYVQQRAANRRLTDRQHEDLVVKAVKRLKDHQRMYNYMRSAEAEARAAVGRDRGKTIKAASRG